MVNVMTEYSVLFAVKMTAKNVKDLERKVEPVEEKLSKALGKRVFAYQYGELVKKDRVQTTLTDDDTN